MQLIPLKNCYYSIPQRFQYSKKQVQPIDHYSKQIHVVEDEVLFSTTKRYMVPKKGSESDIILKNGSSLFFIEAKLTATNKTLPTSGESEIRKKYELGGNRWYQKVFLSGFEAIAVTNKKYELLRFWLLGSWIAHQLDLDYYMINLVLSEREKTIEENFKKHIRANDRNTFLRTTWEEIYHFDSENASESLEKSKIMEYFRN